MPKYLCLQRSLPGASATPEKPSPAQMQAMYAKFNEWREKFQPNLVDLGGRLGAGKIAAHDPAPDGPLIEVKEIVGGYMILSAQNLDEASLGQTSFGTSTRDSSRCSFAEWELGILRPSRMPSKRRLW